MKVLFDFQCNSCEHVQEYRVERDTKTMECPECQSDMRKLIGAAPFILKGSGWAQDYKRKENAIKGARAKAKAGIMPTN